SRSGPRNRNPLRRRFHHLMPATGFHTIVFCCVTSICPWCKWRGSNFRPGSNGDRAAPRLELSDDYPNIDLDDPLGDGVACETSNVVDVQLAHEMLAMFVHGFKAYTEFRRHLLVGFAFGDQLKH